MPYESSNLLTTLSVLSCASALAGMTLMGLNRYRAMFVLNLLVVGPAHIALFAVLAATSGEITVALPGIPQVWLMATSAFGWWREWKKERKDEVPNTHQRATGHLAAASYLALKSKREDRHMENDAFSLAARASAVFERHMLDDEYSLLSGTLPIALVLGKEAFEALWRIRPTEEQYVQVHGRTVPVPRREQAFGMDYSFAGTTRVALDVPNMLEPFRTWATAIDERLNGILVNWYDGNLGHYIGRHRDSVQGMIFGAPIVTISLGEERVFRLRPYKGEGFIDFRAEDGAVFVMPYDTNLAWTHEVPHFRRHKGRRISVTMRAFDAN